MGLIWLLELHSFFCPHKNILIGQKRSKIVKAQASILQGEYLHIFKPTRPSDLPTSQSGPKWRAESQWFCGSCAAIFCNEDPVTTVLYDDKPSTGSRFYVLGSVWATASHGCFSHTVQEPLHWTTIIHVYHCLFSSVATDWHRSLLSNIDNSYPAGCQSKNPITVWPANSTTGLISPATHFCPSLFWDCHPCVTATHAQNKHILSSSCFICYHLLSYLMG